MKRRQTVLTIYQLAQDLNFKNEEKNLNDLTKNMSSRTAYEFKNNIFPDFHDHCFAYKINYGKLKRNIYISAGDGTGFNRLALDWCDVYAKINIDKSKIPNKYSIFSLFSI